jgi:hypothetical protein
MVAEFISMVLVLTFKLPIESTMTHKIFKYSLAVQEKQEINLPKGARIIRVADVDGLFFLWAIVDTETTEVETRKIEMYKTGHEFTTHPDKLKYLGECKLFIMQELGLYVFEVIQDVR